MGSGQDGGLEKAEEGEKRRVRKTTAGLRKTCEHISGREGSVRKTAGVRESWVDSGMLIKRL